MLKAIPGFDGRYFASEDGSIYNAHIVQHKPHINPKTGYCQHNLRKNGKLVMRYAHRLIAETFLKKPDYPCEVNHIDGNKQNNAVCNLQWVTRSENMKHAWENGLRIPIVISAYTKDGNFVATFESEQAAMKFCGVDYNAGISRCLTGKAPTAHGYIWKYGE